MLAAWISVFRSLGLGERPAGRKGAVRRGIPSRAQTLARRVRQACRIAEDDECLRASAIVVCTESVEQPPLKLFAVRLAKDLLGLRGNVSMTARFPLECRHS